MSHSCTAKEKIVDDFFWMLLIVGIIEIVILYFVIKTAVKQAIRETRDETKGNAGTNDGNDIPAEDDER